MIPGTALQTAERVRVLVVEDDGDLRRAMRDVFMMRGFAVNSARDGQDGLKLALSDRYDVVVTDVRMPGISGIDLTRRILLHRPGFRVIVITAYPEWNVSAAAAEAGASRVIVKPISLAKLAEIIEQLAAGPDAGQPSPWEDGDQGGEA